MKDNILLNHSKTFVVPLLTKKVQEKLPQYCPLPTKNNLATQYYFLIKELEKENKKLQKEKQRFQKENQQLKKEIEDLEKKIEDLTLERDKFLKILFNKRKRILKRDSSIKTKSFKPRERESYIRPLPQRIDEEKEAILKCCPYCQTKLLKKVASYQRIIEDIPSHEEQKVKVVRYTINRYWCQKCKKIVRTKPKEVLPKSRLGINTFLYVIYLKYRLRLTQDLIQEKLKTYFNLNISEGEINQLLNKGRVIFKEKWKNIIALIRASPCVHSDETGWRINGENSWLWNFVEEKAVFYTISQSRGKGVPQKVLGEDFNGVVVSDFYPVYNQFKKKQKCWVHLLRKVKELENLTKERAKFQTELQRLYQRIISFRNQSLLKEKERIKKANLIEKELLKISQRKTKDQGLQRIYNLINKYIQDLLYCLKNPKIPSDNNLAERALRPLVIQRKISQGNKTIKGAQTQEINLSVIETLRREGGNLFDSMKKLVLNYIASNSFSSLSTSNG